MGLYNRSKHSTIHPILHLLNICATSNNQISKEYVLCIFCDLSKAFDVINHKILLEKMYRYGIRGNVLKWFESYLSNRDQYVDFDGQLSPRRFLKCGVPQGSILGPLLFLIYVNDIQYATSGTIFSFADDTTLTFSNSKINELYAKANEGLCNIYQWFCANKLKLNANKTKYTLIRPVYRTVDFDNLTLHIGGTPVKRIGDDQPEKSIKFLGLVLDEHLRWRHHIDYINKKIAYSLFTLTQLKYTLPKESLLTLYHALIYPHLSYSLLAWGNASRKELNRTVTLQKKAIRVVNIARYNGHTDPLFKKTNILKLEDMYEHQVCMFMCDYEQNRLPRSFENIFRHNSDIHITYNTRNSHLFYIEKSHSNFTSQLPLYNFPKIWNRRFKANSDVKSRKSLNARLRENMLSSYLDVVVCKNRRCGDCYPTVL